MLKEHPQIKKECTIVALTAYVNKDNIDRCKELGMKAVLNKPAQSDKIYKEVQQACPQLRPKFSRAVSVRHRKGEQM